MDVYEKIKLAEEQTNTNPTELQKEKGNYKKGKITIEDLQITIENPVGSTRSGKDKNDVEWEIKMPYSYGYFNGTLGKDGDQVDVYLGNHFEDFDVYIVDQVFEDTRAFDEHKVMFGFEDEEKAKQAYMDCYKDDWKGFGSITRITLNKFKEWLSNSAMNKYPASKLNMSAKTDYKNVDLGDRISLVRLFGEVEAGKTLLNLQKQVGDLEDFDKLIIEIASPGGSVSEGLEIMIWLDGLSQLGKEIITVVVANAYSIASLIMLSADIKLISKHGKVMVHNPMVPELKYVNANDLEKHISELRELETSMYDLYEMFTGLEREEIKQLMDNETYLLPQEAVDYGFADMVVDIKPRSFEMVTKTIKTINMSKTINTLNRVMAMVNQSTYVNQTYTDTDSGSEIEIFQSDPSTYTKGDRTSLESGVVTLSDGAKITIEDFVITEIDRSVTPKEDEEAAFNEGAAPKEDEVLKTAEEVVTPAPSVETPVKEEEKKEDAKKVIEKTESTVTTKEVQNVQIKQVNKWESDVVNETFNMGDKVEYVPYEADGEPYSVGAGEWELEDGSTVLTDAEGIIRYMSPAKTETPTEAVKTDEDKKAKAMDDEMEAKFEARVAEMEAKFEAKIKAIEKSSEEKADEVAKKMDSVNKFQETAAEAIDLIASNVSSGFKPQAKAKVQIGATGSIFQRLKQERGI